MSQQINLLQVKARAPQPALLGFVIAIVGVVAVVFAYGYAAERRTSQLRAQADNGALRVATLKSAIQSARAVQKDGGSATAVEAEIASLRPRAQAATDLVASLRSGQAGNAEGFSRPLALAGAQVGDGLWITGVEIAKGAKEMVVSGGAERHEAVVLYARRLNEVFAPYGLQFRSVELKPETVPGAAPGTPAAVTFKLS